MNHQDQWSVTVGRVMEMEPQMDVVSAASQLQNLMQQHQAASSQIQVLEGYRARIGRQMLCGEIDGRDGDTLHLSLRLSTVEGVMAMYEQHRDRQWAAVQALSQAIIQALQPCGGDDAPDRGDAHSPMEQDDIGETGTMWEMSEEAGLDRTLGATSVEATSEYMNQYTTGPGSPPWSQTSLGGHLQDSDHHTAMTSSPWQEPMLHQSPPTSPRSDKAAARWTNITRQQYRAS